MFILLKKISKEAATVERQKRKGKSQMDIESVNELGVSNVRPGRMKAGNNMTNNLRDYKGPS